MKSTLQLILPMLLGLTTIAAAPAVSPQSLPDSVKLTYNVNYFDTGLGNLVTELSRNGDIYEVRAETRAEGLASILLGGTLREQCKFSVSDSMEVRPRHYTIEKEGSDPYTHSAEFLWEEMKVAYDDGKSLDIPLAGYVIDNCTVPFAFAAADGITVKEYPYIHILGGKRLRHYEDIQVSRETVEVPAGTFDTVRIDQKRVGSPDKKLSIWVAPDMRNIAVRIEERRKMRVTTMELAGSEGL